MKNSLCRSKIIFFRLKFDENLPEKENIGVGPRFSPTSREPKSRGTSSMIGSLFFNVNMGTFLNRRFTQWHITLGKMPQST